MERKSPNLGNWKRVVEHRFTVDCVDSSDFHGFVTRFHIDRVSEPRIKYQGKRRWCIADNCYLWMQYFPDGCCYTARTIFNAARQVEQWYIDICKPYELDHQGIPTYDDLDLDVVIWPDGEIELWDADELDQALRDGTVSQADYDLAWAEAERLMAAIRSGRLILPKKENDLPRWVPLP